MPRVPDARRLHRDRPRAVCFSWPAVLRRLITRGSTRLVEYAIGFDESAGQVDVAVTWAPEARVEERTWLETYTVVAYAAKMAMNLRSELDVDYSAFLVDVTGKGRSATGWPHPGWTLVPEVANAKTTYFAQVFRRPDALPFIQTPNKGKGARRGLHAGDSVHVLLAFVDGQSEDARARLYRGLRAMKADFDFSWRAAAMAPYAAMAHLEAEGLVSELLPQGG